MSQTSRRSPSPEIDYTRSFSVTPGSQQDLDRVLQRWELALAQKAKALLHAERQER